MEPVGVDRTHILVLNYNGRDLLDECLPTIVEAALGSPVPCGVSVIDNASTDDSLAYLAARWPEIEVIREPNRGLASFNAVLARRSEPIVFLLNNDVKLDPGAVGPMLGAIRDHPDALFAAPLCWTLDGLEYEGMRTRVRSRFGLVQGLCRVPGYANDLARPDLTASAGPVLAVDRARFLAIGGYDRLYHPGRIEDLDLGFRGWMAGWKGYYVPESVAYHRGFGTFGPAFGRDGCDRLAARNTLLFAWKNLAGRRLLDHIAWLPLRLARSVVTGRLGFVRAFTDALALLSEALRARRGQAAGGRQWTRRQEAFFRQFRF
ncbi:MAG TPA: glycosyltransferase [Isosphaeraceae bacterium]